LFPLLLAEGRGEIPPPTTDLVTRVKNLYAEEKWDEILRLVPSSQDIPPELDYFRGMALSRKERWPEAREAFEAGQRNAPQDKRFPLELAGVAFKQNANASARAYLARALRLDPGDAYGNDFLGTLFFLEGNLEAALKYWNRADKPLLEEIQLKPRPLVNPVLLDRAFAFSPASILKLRDLQTTKARLELLEIFPRYRFDLSPRIDQKFDLVFHAIERNGWGNTRLEGIVSLLRGTPYQTIYPEFFNLKQSAWNWVSLLRVDSQKRRVFSSLSGPLQNDPGWRVRFYLDGRRENWDVTRTAQAAVLTGGDILSETLVIGAEIQSSPNGRWGSKNGLAVSHRNFRQFAQAQFLGSPLFINGFSLKHYLRLDRNLLIVPERRITVKSFANWELAKLLGTGSNPYAKGQAGMEFQWFPISKGEDYLLTARIGAGRTFGQTPFDELFNLGQDRDTDLYLRGHKGTRNRKKGNSPLGKDYILWNWEMDKLILTRSFFDLRLGPFLDSGKTYDDSGAFGSTKWLWDVGIQAKVRFRSKLTLLLTFGKDLRTGREAYQANFTR
jgi:tetratricopeptide (TPR) repeat protein